MEEQVSFLTQIANRVFGNFSVVVGIVGSGFDVIGDIVSDMSYSAFSVLGIQFFFRQG